MPKYIDHHPNAPQLPAEVVQQMVEAIKAGRANEFGVKPLNNFVGGGQSWCLTEAPNAEAIATMHQAMGIPQDVRNVIEVQTLV